VTSPKFLDWAKPIKSSSIYSEKPNGSCTTGRIPIEAIRKGKKRNHPKKSSRSIKKGEEIDPSQKRLGWGNHGKDKHQTETNEKAGHQRVNKSKKKRKKKGKDTRLLD